MKFERKELSLPSDLSYSHDARDYPYSAPENASLALGKLLPSTTKHSSPFTCQPTHRHYPRFDVLDLTTRTLFSTMQSSLDDIFAPRVGIKSAYLERVDREPT